MVIKHICYPVRTLGPGNRVGIWTSGCPRKCEGCMTPELQDPQNGREMTVREILRCLSAVPATIDGVTISGGEPFMQAKELRALAALISNEITDDIIVFSGYTLKELAEMNDPDVDSTLGSISVLIDGPYMDALNDGVGLRGSSNQQIYVFKHEEKYRHLNSQTRSIQSFRYGDNILLVGIQ